MNKYIYMVWVPGDCEEELSRYHVLPDKRTAMEVAQEENLKRFGGNWTVKYVRNNNIGWPVDEFNGKQTLVVFQTSGWFNGA